MRLTHSLKTSMPNKNTVGYRRAKQTLAKKNVLVTGAGGCIGAWTVKMLSDLGATPIVYDISDNRSRLQLIYADADKVDWELGDVSDFDRLSEVVKQYDISSIIHLAALQVPFCIADPIASTRINVMGSVNILEVARQHNISGLSYASSIAAPAMGDNEWLATLYGAHKVCSEQMAGVYWQDWQVPSVGIRPAIVYGPGRDQGMSSAPTIAMLAASTGHDYEIPFTGDVSYVHVEDTAQRFIVAASGSYQGAQIFDFNGAVASTEQVIEAINEHISSTSLTAAGQAMPFPAELDDNQLNDFLGLETSRNFVQGVSDTLQSFQEAQSRGIDLSALFESLVTKS